MFSKKAAILFGLVCIGLIVNVGSFNDEYYSGLENPFVKYFNCNSEIEPTSYEEDGLLYTKATPNHQRPCSVSFGGNN
jgi:hypothetical protein